MKLMETRAVGTYTVTRIVDFDTSFSPDEALLARMLRWLGDREEQT